MTMVKFRILAASVLFSGLSLTSCCNDDDSSKTSSIIGKWNFSTQKITTPNGFLISDGPYDGNEAGCNADYLEFSDEHVIVNGDYGEECVLELMSGLYSRDKKNLTLSYGPMNSTDYRILIANETTLVLENRYRYESTMRVAEVHYVKI